MLALFLAFIFLISSPLQIHASNSVEISTGGSVSRVTYEQKNNIEEIRFFADSTEIVKEYVIAPDGSIVNYRLCFEIEGVDVSKSIRFDVNKGTVVQIRLANMSDPKRVNVVVETDKKPDYKLSKSSDGKSIILTLSGSSSSSTAPKPSTSPSPSATPKPSTTPSPSTTPKPSATPSPSTKPSPTPVLPTSTPAKQGSIITKSGPLSWNMSGDSCVISLNGISLSQTSNSSSPRFVHREKEKLIQITIPGKDTAFESGFLSGNPVIYGILVNYNEKQDSTIIRISYAGTISYSHTVTGGSSVFIIKEGKNSIPSNDPTPPASSQKPSDPVTPTPTPKPSPSNPVTPTPTNPNTTAPVNIKAGSGDGNTILSLLNASMSNFKSEKDKIVVDESKDKSTVTFMIPSNIVNIGNGTLVLNDSVVNSITTFTTSKNTFLTLNKKDPNKQFEITVGNGSDELLIVQKKGSTPLPTPTPTPTPIPTPPPTVSSKLVVIDPGHGGSDPGAVKNGYHEKNYNLDIALRCVAILKNQGVNVAMTRTTDKYVSLNDRVKFANDRNATLFVSVHNNSMPSGMKGSMVLYHHTSYNGKAFAKIMLDNLIGDLNTGNLGLSGRKNIVVLRDTKMPAILAEVACMSYESDLTLLNSNSFIQKSAESLAKSIIEILE